MAKKKAKVKATRSIQAAKANRPGPKKGAKYKPRAPKVAEKVYAVVAYLHPQLTLGAYASIDAARDAIAAQRELHQQLRTPAPAEVSDADIAMMSENEPVAPAVEAPTLVSSFNWTIVVRQKFPGETVFSQF